ncbi:hypothetical protein [Actinoplanes sp. NPDC049118]
MMRRGGGREPLVVCVAAEIRHRRRQILAGQLVGIDVDGKIRHEVTSV